MKIYSNRQLLRVLLIMVEIYYPTVHNKNGERVRILTLEPKNLYVKSICIIYIEYTITFT